VTGFRVPLGRAVFRIAIVPSTRPRAILIRCGSESRPKSGNVYGVCEGKRPFYDQLLKGKWNSALHSRMHCKQLFLIAPLFHPKERRPLDFYRILSPVLPDYSRTAFG
jgi:hypothetical protein